jgi:hypoxanthine phosphoribosyltransferase
MDEVDDTRTTLSYCCQEVLRTSKPAAVACAVVHNKLKHKEASLPADVVRTTHRSPCRACLCHVWLLRCTSRLYRGQVYFAAEDVPNLWNCYPWDAAAYGHTIVEHEELARQCLCDFPPASSRERCMIRAGRLGCSHIGPMLAQYQVQW